MQLARLPPVQLGLPEFVPDLIGFAGAIVLLLILVAITGFAYKTMTGGVEWPEEGEEDDDALRQGGQDDEWDYY